MNLKEKIFEFIRRRQPARQAVFPRFANARNILIIYESDLLERNDLVKSLRDQLLREDKDVTLWGYVDKKDIQSLVLPQSRILGRKDFTIFGTLRDGVKQDLTRREYDLMIDLTLHPCLPLHYVAMFANAHFKAGLHLRDGLHDFLLETDAQDTPEFLFNQITHYLKSINTHDQA